MAQAIGSKKLECWEGTCVDGNHGHKHGQLPNKLQALVKNAVWTGDKKLDHQARAKLLLEQGALSDELAAFVKMLLPSAPVALADLGQSSEEKDDDYVRYLPCDPRYGPPADALVAACTGSTDAETIANLAAAVRNLYMQAGCAFDARVAAEEDVKDLNARCDELELLLAETVSGQDQEDPPEGFPGIR